MRPQAELAAPIAKDRNENLDLLRALAIVGVLVYHVGGMWPIKYEWLTPFLPLGKYGVTLFFVLSGWLIGGIYWRELGAKGRVAIGRFWIRRWLRTVPPYLVGLLLAFAAVHFERSEPFDVRYLLFGQNYERKIPFYLVSWSLCVEEHFYLALPILGLFVGRLNARVANILLWLCPLLPIVARLIDPGARDTPAFGYAHTATHLVFEGLALGVAGAHTSRFFPERWSFISQLCRIISLPAMAIFISTIWWSDHAVYYFGQSAIAFCCLVWLAAIEGQAPLVKAAGNLIHMIAISSYSLYLTHSLAIHAARRIARPSEAIFSGIFCLAVWVAIISIAGAVFYFLIEKRSIQLRDWVSRFLFDKKRLADNCQSAPSELQEPLPGNLTPDI